MKINGGFVSLFEYSDSKHKVLTKPRRFNANPSNVYLDQYIGSVQPMVSIGNDLVDTMARYKSVKDIAGDFTQPVEGFVNLLQGLKLIGYLPFMLIYFTWQNRHRPQFQETTLKEMAFSGSWFIHGCATTLRGLTQMVTTPLTWFVKMPLRGVITAIYGFTPVEESLQYLIKHTQKPVTEENHEQNWILVQVLHKKYMKAAMQGQSSRIGYKKEESAYKPLFSGWRYKDSDVQNYFKLFTPLKQNVNDEPSEKASADMNSMKIN